MQSMWFFLLVFTAIYGAVKLVSVVYDGIINYIRNKGKRKRNAGKQSEFTGASGRR